MRPDRERAAHLRGAIGRTGRCLARALAAAVALAAATAGAEGWELAASAGKVVPFYSQSFEYDPGALTPPISGVMLEQRGVFMLDGHGGLALNVSLARDLGRHVAVEGRLDTADVSVNTIGARYRLRANLPAPLPPISTDVDLGTGSVDLERLRPLSLNLKVQGGGRTRVAASAGVSWLPAFRFVVKEAVGIGLPILGSRLAFDVAQVGLTAEARPSEQGQGRLGGNVGVSIGIAAGRRVRVILDARYFHFQEQTLHWGRAQTSGTLSAIQEAVVRQIESRLEPVVFNPTFFHASVGVALAF